MPSARRIAGRWVLLALACSAAAGRPAAASLIVALDLPTLVARADHIAVVDVVSIKTAWDEPHEKILSTIQLSVVDSWKGAPAAAMTVVQPGGTVGDLTMTVEGMTRFASGERALVFLRGPATRAQVVGMAQGKRALRRDASTGRWMVKVPDKAGGDFVRTHATGDHPPVLDTRERALDDLRAEVRALAAGQPTKAP